MHLPCLGFTKLLKSVNLYISPNLENLEHYFFKYFFLILLSFFFWNLHILDLLILPYISLTPYSFHFQFFLCYLNWIISIDLFSISLTFTSVIFLTGLSSYFHISDIIFFSIRFPFNSFYNFSLSLSL